MPSFTNTMTDLVMAGPIVDVVFSPSQAAIAAGQSPKAIQVNAMVDTGATSTVITPGIAAQLGLQPVGQIMMRTPTTTAPVASNQYSVDVHFPLGKVTVRSVVVSEAGLIGQNIQCLIGRDVLRHGVLIYIGYNNQFTLSF